MKLWMVILVLGAAFCAYVLLKAREMETASTYKKLTKVSSKSVAKAAKRAKADIGRPALAPPAVERIKETPDISVGATSIVVRERKVEKIAEGEI